MQEERPALLEILSRIDLALDDRPKDVGLQEAQLSRNHLITIRGNSVRGRDLFTHLQFLGRFLEELWQVADQEGFYPYAYKIGRIRADLDQYMIDLADDGKRGSETLNQAKARLSKKYHDQEAALGAYFAKHELHRI